jgi:RNA-directed DNA polymerase
MGRIQITHTYDYIISAENLLAAWQEFSRGKRKRTDVLVFERQLMTNILALRRELLRQTYRHGAYEAFNIADPKPRNIHKATVRDRLLHHTLYRVLYPFFDRTFIADSYSCRKGKGTHKALLRFRTLGYKVSKNHTTTAWVLKCDIKKFFASIDQPTLLDILAGYIPDKRILWLIERIVESFASTAPGKGLPLGNLTSQLLVNIYMNEFDQFVKHKLKAKYYVRYADDFVFLSEDKARLEGILVRVDEFLKEKLQLTLHPDKVFIKTLASGVNFLGWVHFPDHRVLRTATKRRMLRNIAAVSAKPETVQSYLGLLQHGNAKKLQKKIAESVEHNAVGIE